MLLNFSRLIANCWCCQPFWGYTAGVKDFSKSFCRVQPGEYMFEVMEGYE